MKKTLSILLFIYVFMTLSMTIYCQTKVYYSIQVGAYTKASNAEIMYNRIKNLGLTPYKKINKENIIVRVGRLDNKSDAENALIKLKNANINGYITEGWMEVKERETNQEKKQDNTVIEDSNIERTNNNSLETKNEKLDISVKNYRFQNDIKVEGVFQNYNYYFNTSKYWEFNENCYFELVFSRTNIKTYKNSTLSILINDYPVHSTFIKDKKRVKSTIRIKLPKDKILQGFNKITLKTYHRITEDQPCEDVVNPGNWLIFNKKSYVHLEYSKLNDSVKIVDFPYPYVENEDSNPINTVILVPDNVKSEEVKAITLMSAIINKKILTSEFVVDVLKVKDIKYALEKNSIFIGNINDLPNEWEKYFSESEKEFSKKNAIIKEVVAPYNENKKLLFIISDNIESLLKAIHSLNNKKMVSQMIENTQIIKEDANVEEDKNISGDYFTFEDLGYAPLLFEGILYQRATVDVDLPDEWEVTQGAKIHLNMRYSELLNYERSGLNLYLNNVPIASKKLSIENANEEILDIEIPNDLLGSNYYQLEMVFYFELFDRDCLFRREKSSWSYVVNDSYFYLPHKNEKSKILNNYINPFSKDNRLDNLLFVIPDESEKNFRNIRMINNILSYMVQRVDYIGNINVIKASELSEKYKDYNIVVLGIPNNNKIIKEWNKYLHIKFDDEYKKFQSNEKINLLADYNKELASIQLIESPLNKNKDAMIVTATVKDALMWAIRHLTDTELVDKLNGNALLIDELGQIQHEYFGAEFEKNKEIVKKIEEAIKEDTIKEETNKRNFDEIKNFIIWIVAIIIVIVVALIILLRRRKTRKR